MKRFWAIVFMIIIGSLLTKTALIAETSTTISNPNNDITVSLNDTFYMSPNITVTSATNILGGSLVVNNLPSDASISYTNVSGISVSYDSGKNLYTMSGSATAEAYQQLFRSFQMTTGSTAQSGVTLSYTINTGSGSAAYFSDTGHYYEFVSSTGINWYAAKTAASNRVFNERQGYLATITSQAENDFIKEKLTGDGWFGASDNEVEGTWKWVTGPEAGTQFWQDLVSAGNDAETYQGYTVNGEYANWNPGEPNNAYNGLGEDCAQMYIASATWNDLYYANTGSIGGYIVEYGGLLSDTITGDYEETITLNITNQHTLTFLDYNGALLQSAAYTVGTDLSEVSAPSDPSRSGYTFTGWDSSIPSTMPDQNVTITATYSPITYNITYNLNGGTNGSNPATYTIETSTITLADASRTGYTFGGWYSDSGFTTQVTSIPQGSTGNLTLYAKWTPITYNITYNLNGGTNGSNPATYTVETSTITLADASRTGYTFGGWYSDSGFTTQVTNIPQGSTGDVTLYAKWTPISYNITYNLDGGTNGSNPATYTIETSTITLAAASKTGYTFGGWYSDSGFTTQVTNIPQGSTGDVTLYAKWTINTYTLTYYVKNVDGVVTSTKDYTYDYGENVDVTLPTQDVIEGYQFIWDTLPVTMPANDVTIIGEYYFDKDGVYYQCIHFVEDLNRIRDNLQGKYILMNDIDFNDDASYTDPTATGIDWNGDGSSSENIKTQFTSSFGWEPIGNDTSNFDGIFDGNGHTITNLYINKSSSNYIGLFGYLYLGIVENLNITNANITGVGRTGILTGINDFGSISNVTVEGTLSGQIQWIGGIAGYNNSTITNSSATVTITGSASYIGGITGYNNTSGVISDSYSFVTLTGWNVIGGLAGKNTGSIENSYANGTITWGNDYIGGFIGDNSGSVKNAYSAVAINLGTSQVGGLIGHNSGSVENTYSSGDINGSSYAGALIGYHDVGSSVINSYSLGNILENSVEGNVIGYINSSSSVTNVYKIDLVNNTKTDALGTTTAITMNELNSTSWQNSILGANNGANQWEFSYLDFSNDCFPVLFLKGTENLIPLQISTITFDSSGGSNVEAIIQNIGTSVAAPSNPTKTGYTFTGWDLTIPSTMPVNNLTITASWIPTVYNITYNLNGGTNGSNPSTYTIETSTITLADASRTGYTFGGWYSDSGLTTQVMSIPQGSTGNVTLYAKWTPITYDITYNLNSGTNGSNPSTYTIETSTITLADASRTGYTFGGWYSDSGLTTQVMSIPQGSTGNVTLYAKWTPITYDITYNLDSGVNGSNPATYTIETSTITLADASRTGYTFGGWYSDSGFTTQVTSIAHGSTGDVTLYAKWTVNTYNITYNLNSGTNGSNPSTYTIETPTISLVNASRTGYTFGGWYLDSTFTIQVSCIVQGSTGDVTLYAKWTPITYNITYNLNSGTNGSNPSTYTIETSTITLADASRTGYTFGGWYSDSGFTTQVTSIAQGSTGNVTLYAKWTIIAYNITYNLNSGTNGSNPDIYNIETSTITLANASRTGYTFGGWFSDSGFTSQVTNIPQGSTGDVTLYAKWIVNDYDVVFDNNSGSGSMSPQSITFGASSILNANAFSNEGYQFNGWNTKADGSGISYKNQDNFTMNMTGITLYAQWMPNNYSITFESNSGTGTMDDQFILFGESKTLSNNEFTKEGYRFDGWNTLADGSGMSYKNGETITMNTTGITLYAKWIPNVYNVTFIDYDGTIINTHKVNYNATLSNDDMPQNPTRVGYTFSGWDAELPTSMPDYDIVITATYTINQYKIDFIDYDGNVIQTDYIDYNQNVLASITLPTPDRLGYTFNGWDTVVPQYMPARDLVITAMYTLNQYQLKFENEDGSTIKIINVNYQTDLSTLLLPNPPSKIGYTFTGWDTTLPNFMPANNIVLVAQYNVNTYQIIFENEDGSVITSVERPYQSDLSDLQYPTPPDITGYRFNKWSMTLPSKMTPYDLIISARYAVNSYHIIFQDSDGSVIQANTFAYQEMIPSSLYPNNPTKEGFTFTGWDLSLPSSMPASDLVLTASWVEVVEETTLPSVVGNIQSVIDSFTDTNGSGSNAKIKIEIHQQTENEVSQEEESLINEAVKNLPGSNMKHFNLDISLIVEMEGQNESEIHNLNEPLTITVTIPEEYQGFDNYQVIRIHNGVTQVLDSSYDPNTHTITFRTDAFSTYSVAYSTGSNDLWLLILLLIPAGYITYRVSVKKKQDLEIK